MTFNEANHSGEYLGAEREPGKRTDLEGAGGQASLEKVWVLPSDGTEGHWAGQPRAGLQSPNKQEPPSREKAGSIWAQIQPLSLN